MARSWLDVSNEREYITFCNHAGYYPLDHRTRMQLMMMGAVKPGTFPYRSCDLIYGERPDDPDEPEYEYGQWETLRDALVGRIDRDGTLHVFDLPDK